MNIMSKLIISKALPSKLRTNFGRILQAFLASMGWVIFILTVLPTTLLGGWILLAAVLLHSGPTNEQPVLAVMFVLLAVTGGLAWLVAKYLSSPRKVVRVIRLILAPMCIIGVTWAVSTPSQALYLAREMAWDGTDRGEIWKHPQQAIVNATPAFNFPQNLTPEQLQTIEYMQDGQIRQASIDEFLQSSHTTAFIVLKDDAIRYEGYFNGDTRDSIITSFSISKSFASALVGIAIDEGYIHSVNDRISYYLPELRGKGLDAVTIRNLLMMSTGIQYVHKDELPGLVQMLPFNDDSRTTNYADLRSVALSAKPDGDIPGARFEYNNRSPQLLGLILERATHRSVSKYLEEKIWQPLGMEYPASWSLDSSQSGFEMMQTGVNARAIDFLKFGKLFLDKGQWNGQQIVSEQWVKESTSPDPYDHRDWLRATPWKDANGYYKYMWWGKLRPDGSYAYMARGGSCQFIAVFPTEHAVVVRFGLDEGGLSPDAWFDVFERVITKLN